jgi:hypothetical protein
MLEKKNPENMSNFLSAEFAPEYNQPTPKCPKSLHENLASTSSRKVDTDMGYKLITSLCCGDCFLNAIFSRTRIGFLISGAQSMVFKNLPT